MNQTQRTNCRDAGRGELYSAVVLAGTDRLRELEIVDNAGRARAVLPVMPPMRVEGKDYPEIVLLRLIDSKSGRVVKLTASERGSRLLLSDAANDGLRIGAPQSGNQIEFFDRARNARVIEP